MVLSGHRVAERLVYQRKLYWYDSFSTQRPRCVILSVILSPSNCWYFQGLFTVKMKQKCKQSIISDHYLWFEIEQHRQHRSQRRKFKLHSFWFYSYDFPGMQSSLRKSIKNKKKSTLEFCVFQKSNYVFCNWDSGASKGFVSTNRTFVVWNAHSKFCMYYICKFHSGMYYISIFWGTPLQVVCTLKAKNSELLNRTDATLVTVSERIKPGIKLVTLFPEEEKIGNFFDVDFSHAWSNLRPIHFVLSRYATLCKVFCDTWKKRSLMHSITNLWVLDVLMIVLDPNDINSAVSSKMMGTHRVSNWTPTFFVNYYIYLFWVGSDVLEYIWVLSFPKKLC